MLRRRYAFPLGIFALAVLFVGGQVASGAGTVANVALSGFFAVLLIPVIVSLAVLMVRWVLPGRNADMDSRPGLIKELVNLSSGLVTEHGPRSCS